MADMPIHPSIEEDVAAITRGVLKRLWWEKPNHERTPLHCPFRGEVPWTQLPLERSARMVVEANRERTERRKLKTPSIVSEAEIALLAGLLFYGEMPRLQAPVGRYDVDFLIADYDAAIEVDGKEWHDAKKDARRDAHLFEQHGIRTYRVPARDALRDPLWAARYTCQAIVSDRRSRAA